MGHFMEYTLLLENKWHLRSYILLPWYNFIFLYNIHDTPFVFSKIIWFFVLKTIICKLRTCSINMPKGIVLCTQQYQWYRIYEESAFLWSSLQNTPNLSFRHFIWMSRNASPNYHLDIQYFAHSDKQGRIDSAWIRPFRVSFQPGNKCILYNVLSLMIA